MKSNLLYSLMMLCLTQPALAQQFESDEQWQQMAAQQMKMQNSGRVQQSTKKAGTTKKGATRQTAAGYTAMKTNHGGYGYRPQRSSMRSSYGYRPNRTQLMSPAEAEHLQQMRLKMQQRMQMMQSMSGQQPQSGGGANPLQALMGGGGQQPNPAALQGIMGGQQQRPGQPQFNRGELMKSFFGGGGGGSSQGQTGF